MRVFKETQRFDQWWLRLIVTAVIAVCGLSIANAFEIKDKDTVQFWIHLTLSILTILVLVYLLLFTKLETKIDEIGIHYAFWPFNLKSRLLRWRDIVSCTVRKYRPIAEYGGWGYRTGFTKNSGALNVKGNTGIQIEFKNGKKLLLGTQKEAEARRILTTYSEKINRQNNLI
ncbi:hypothetical protein [Marixanthomonas spongiae]|uniref:Uncharacterized protein n=1 Tax=Marixanthomonas spongiae TaxID=2174845 RepID=A0A2U0I5G0_9FLAO|nr:hypothetical protein [Marixanthomonas spongiae]PVW16345.1 hypothetical protein DDV96_03545 [Marixanthomonas spongiae]